MYRGFNLSLVNSYNKYIEYGNLLYKSHSINIQHDLEKYISVGGSLNGTNMRNDWFPSVNADVFISHSHNDKDKAIELAGWLWKNFKMKAFVDSIIWGHANVLLKEIDNRFCRNNDESTYNYRKRNDSTSHVYSMLSVALTMMIDKTECLFFLNTPKSLTASESIQKTKSPWIYMENTISRFIQKKERKEHRIEFKNEMIKKSMLYEEVDIVHEIDLNHLKTINDVNLIKWSIEYDPNDGIHPLDILYNQKNIF